MKIQYFLGLSGLALLILLPPLGWAQTRTFHTPGGNITPGSEGQGSQNAPRGQNITPPGGSTSGGSTGSTPGGSSTSSSTVHTPGGNLTPGSEGQGSQNAPRGQNITPQSTSTGSTTGGTSRPSTLTTPSGSITSKSQRTGQSGQSVRQGTSVNFPREYVGQQREGSRVTSPTKGTSRIGPGIPTTPGERTTIDYKYQTTPQRGQSGQNLRGGPVRLEGEYVGEHRQPRATEVRSSTKGTSRIGPGISTSPAGRQTINVGGPQSVTGTSPKTGVTVGAPVGTFKSGIEVPSFGGPKAGSQQAMPVGGGPPGMSPGMQAPAPSGVSVPVEAPPPVQKVPSIDVP